MPKIEKELWSCFGCNYIGPDYEDSENPKGTKPVQIAALVQVKGLGSTKTIPETHLTQS